MQIRQYLMSSYVKVSQAQFVMFVTVGIVLALEVLCALQLAGHVHLIEALSAHLKGYTHSSVVVEQKLSEDPPPPVPPYLFHA